MLKTVLYSGYLKLSFLGQTVLFSVHGSMKLPVVTVLLYILKLECCWRCIPLQFYSKGSDTIVHHEWKMILNLGLLEDAVILHNTPC